MVQLMVRIRLNGKIVRKTTPQAGADMTAAAASTAAASVAAPPLVTAVALCLPRLLSLAHHSCLPNCILLGGARRLISLRPIAASEPLTISYLPLHELRAWDTQARRDRLWEDYLFVCTCPRCAAADEGEAAASTREQVQGDADKLQQDWTTLLAAMDAVIALDAAQQSVAGSAVGRPLVVSRCSVCAQATDQRCSQCKSVHFCSRDCQKLAWREHKAECKLRAAKEKQQQQGAP